MKKKTIALLIGLMSVAMLAACGNNSETTTEDAATEEAEAVVAEPVEEVTEDASAEDTTAADTAAEDTVAEDTQQAAADEVIDDQAEFEKLKESLVYMGGLNVTDDDLQFAMYRNNDSGDLLVYVKKQGSLDYGMLETEDAKLDDGTEYSKFNLGGTDYGYYFNEDLVSGIFVDGGNKYDGTELTEDAALKLVEETMLGAAADTVNDASEDPEGEFERVKENLVYMGGLYISDPKNDLMFALFKNDGLPIAIITKLGKVWYGEYTTEDAKLDDGTAYTKMLINGAEFGYYFNDDMTGILIDEDGKKYDAKELDESVALDMVKKNITG